MAKFLMYALLVAICLWILLGEWGARGWREAIEKAAEEDSQHE